MEYFSADLHLGHKRMVEIHGSTGLPNRPFRNVDDHDATIIKNINDTCEVTDKLYVLGDVTMNSKYLRMLSQIHCKLSLVMGNHEHEDTQTYLKYFVKVQAYRVFDKFIVSHMPIHAQCVERFNVNVHGHTHATPVLHYDGRIDERYICVSQEQIECTPVSMTQLEERINLTVGGRVRVGGHDHT